MKIFHVIRANEWWYNKFPPLLAIAYATASMSSMSLYKVLLWVLFLLVSLTVGAIFVSVINDISDLEEDLATGKVNRIQNVTPKFRWIIPIICLLIGCIVEFILYPDILSCILYICPWIVFSLYSFPPFRLKVRGILGVFADALGSHLFISLLMVSSICRYTGQSINFTWIVSVGIWSFCYGLRGILYHQFMDRENDLKISLNTFASKIDPNTFKGNILTIILLEATALAVILYEINSSITLVALLLYFLLMIIRTKMYGQKIIMVLLPENSAFQIFLADYYETFLPLAIIASAIIMDIKNSSVLIIFLILFPNRVKTAFVDYLKYLKRMYIYST